MDAASINRTICIIGGGPAGLSCALWAKQDGLSPIIVEKEAQLGGEQHMNRYAVRTYLGIQGKTGPDFIREFIRHTEAEMLPTLLNATLQRIWREGDDFRIQAGRTELLARAIVICTGQHVRGYADVTALPGSQLLQASPQVCFDPGATLLHWAAVAGQQVAVIGGGDNGLSAATTFCRTAAHTHLLVRSTLRASGLRRQWLVEGIQAGKITLHQPAQLQGFATQGEQITIFFQTQAGKGECIVVDFVCFRLGYAPNVEAIQHLLRADGLGPLALTPSGHIQTDEFCRTSLARIYAAGDVANPRDPCVATAVAQGAIAARSLDEDLRAQLWQSP